MLKVQYLCSASVSALVMTALMAGAAAAQTGATEPAALEEVVVTGSFIAGTPKTTSIPVAVIGQAELERRGSPSVLERFC